MVWKQTLFEQDFNINETVTLLYQMIYVPAHMLAETAMKVIKESNTSGAKKIEKNENAHQHRFLSCFIHQVVEVCAKNGFLLPVKMSEEISQEIEMKENIDFVLCIHAGCR